MLSLCILASDDIDIGGLLRALPEIVHGKTYTIGMRCMSLTEHFLVDQVEASSFQKIRPSNRRRAVRNTVAEDKAPSSSKRAPTSKFPLA